MKIIITEDGLEFQPESAHDKEALKRMAEGSITSIKYEYWGGYHGNLKMRIRENTNS